MIIHVVKFGKILISRPAGKEAAAVMASMLMNLPAGEAVTFDFDQVQVVAPSWLDEVLQTLRDKYGTRIVCKESDNLSLKESLKTLRDFP